MRPLKKCNKNEGLWQIEVSGKLFELTSIKILMMRWFPASVGMNDKGWLLDLKAENYKLKEGLEREGLKMPAKDVIE